LIQIVSSAIDTNECRHVVTTFLNIDRSCANAIGLGQDLINVVALISGVLGLITVPAKSDLIALHYHVRSFLKFKL
jgi:hypothetical protein